MNKRSMRTIAHPSQGLVQTARLAVCGRRSGWLAHRPAESSAGVCDTVVS